MKRSTILALLFGTLLVVSQMSQVRAEEEEDDDDDEPPPMVVEITDKTFEEHVTNKKFALVAFTAPWCGHCKALKPAWSEAAGLLKEVEPELTVGNVDATKETELAKKFEVKGYPTIKFFIDGEAQEYNGGRTADEIVSWVKKRTGPPAKTIDSVDGLKEALEGENSFVVGYFDKLEGAAYETFIKAARALNEAEVFETTSKDVAKAVKLSKAGSTAVVRKFFDEWEYVSSEGHAAFKGKDEDLVKLNKFLKDEMAALYLPYNQKNHGKLFEGSVEHFTFIFGSKDDIEKAEKAWIKPVVKKFRGKIVATSIDVEDTNANGIINYFIGSEKPEGMQIMGWHKEKGKKYSGPTKFDAKSYEKFLNDLIAGKAQVFLKSEDEPENAVDEDGITKVVGKTFEKVVLSDKHDVMLEIYAPWCGHCKSLLPVYKKLAKRFKKIDSVVIAQFDGTANEHEKVDVKGFPTILFYPAGADTPINYEGERTVKEFTKFIKKNAKIDFELPKKSKKGDEDKEEAKDDAKDEL